MADVRTILNSTRHRPFPMPVGPWILFQSWRTQLFGHWTVSRSVLRLLVPNQLRLDEFDGACWVTLTAFRVAGTRPRFLPPIPGLSSFPQLNLRTYVRHGETPGVYMFALDAGSRLTVAGARRLYHLPYRHAAMHAERRDGRIHFRSRRLNGHAEFAARYRPVGEPAEPVPGTLDHFLTERYAVYTVDDRRRVLRGDIHHRPWSLQGAEADVEINTMPAAHGIPRPRGGPLLHYCERQDTLVWRPRAVR